MSESAVVIASTLDSLILESERLRIHIDAGPCEYRLGRGLPLSKKRCSMCTRIFPLIDLSASWIQRIDSGRLSGRSVEILENSHCRSLKDAEACWKTYIECDDSQRKARQSLLHRYYVSFTCNGKHYTLRDSILSTGTSPPPLPIMIAQLLELYSGVGLPKNFVHGNPTVASIGFSGRLPVALRHSLDGGDMKYLSKYLIQIDYGGVDSVACSRKVGIHDELLGAIALSPDRETLTIRAESSFQTFLREYPHHCGVISLHLFLRGLLSLYPRSETRIFMDVIIPSSAKSLREAFEEIKGTTLKAEIFSILRERLKPMLAAA